MTQPINKEEEKLWTIIEREWEYGLENTPEIATFYGENKYNDKLSDLSAEAFAKRLAHSQALAEELKTLNQEELSEENKINYSLFYEKNLNELKELEFKGYYLFINQMEGVQANLAHLMGMMPNKTKKDYENYLARLKALPQQMEQTIDLLKQGLKEGYTVPKAAIINVPAQIKGQIPADHKLSPYYEFLREDNPSIPNELKVEIENAIKNELYSAFKSLDTFLETEYIPNTRTSEGLHGIPNGLDYYNHKLRMMTTTELTAKEVHEKGLSEADRILKEMKELVQKIGFKGTYEEFLEDLKVNPDLYFTDPKMLMMTYRDISKRLDKELPRFFKVLPRLPYGVEEVPEFQAHSFPTAYYMPPDMGMTRAGIFYANTSQLETRPKYEMEALTIHEAVPGHHLQIALSLELDGLPKFRRMAISDYTGYIEGWGLYSEKLGEEMGFYKDLYSKFGQLSFEIWRACRLVIDTGIHAFGWDRTKSIEFLKSYTGKSEQACAVEIDRYMSIPGQATAYKIGELKILELRQKFVDKKGEHFDIREFHDVILRNGALPLNVLEDYVDNYLEKN